MNVCEPFTVWGSTELRFPILPCPKIGQPLAGFFGIGATVEGRNADVALALPAKTASRRDDHLQIVQHPIKHFPTR